MKKTILMLAIAFGASQAFAQDLTSKKGEPYLPEAGDWAISFDAAPFLTYAGNLFSGNTGSNNSPGVNYVANLPWSIVGKMFKDEKTAYRAMVRIGLGSTKLENFVQDQTSTDPTKTVTDEKKTSSRNIVLGGGMEWRRGKTRLQGYYGGMLWISLSGGKTDYTWGNTMDATYTSPISTDWSTMTQTTLSTRTLTSKAGSGFGFGLRGFIGAEYFIFPKISLGAEYGWGLGMMNVGDGEVTTQTFDVPSNSVKETTAKTGGSKTFGLDTDISNNMFGAGSINVTFHF